MKDKPKTGLGSSLLLQRTEKPERLDAQESETSKRPERPDVSKRSADRKVEGRVEKPSQVVLPRFRCTLYIDEDVNEQLSLTAGIEKKQRSEIVTEILRSHLPTYSIERVDHNQATGEAS
jgi:hypothetical protein